MIATPDGVEIVNLTAAVLLSVAFVPYGITRLARQSTALTTHTTPALPAAATEERTTPEPQGPSAAGAG